MKTSCVTTTLMCLFNVYVSGYLFTNHVYNSFTYFSLSCVYLSPVMNVVDVYSCVHVITALTIYFIHLGLTFKFTPTHTLLYASVIVFTLGGLWSFILYQTFFVWDLIEIVSLVLVALTIRAYHKVFYVMFLCALCGLFSLKLFHLNAWQLTSGHAFFNVSGKVILADVELRQYLNTKSISVMVVLTQTRITINTRQIFNHNCFFGKTAFMKHMLLPAACV